MLFNLLGSKFQHLPTAISPPIPLHKRFIVCVAGHIHFRRPEFQDREVMVLRVPRRPTRFGWHGNDKRKVRPQRWRRSLLVTSESMDIV
jgi:hypothetical protein